MDRPRIKWIEEEVDSADNVKRLRGTIKNLIKYIKVLENNAHEERKKVKTVPREGTVGYKSLCNKCDHGYTQGHDRHRCQYCNSYMEMSECGTMGICHYCEFKIPLVLNNAFWHGFGEMVDAMNNYFYNNPHLKIRNEHYDEDEVFDELISGTAFAKYATVYYVGLDHIEAEAKKRWVKDYAEKYRYTDKPKPLVIWYPY